MESLLQRQEIIADAINKLGINFKKDSPSRKTADYIRKRVESLNNLWEEFDTAHNQLLASGITETDYFTSKAYQKVLTHVEALRSKFLNYKILPTAGTSSSEEQGTLSKSDELILQQSSNFRALSRLIRNIDLSKIAEKWEIEDKLQMLQARWKLIDDIHWQIDNILVDSNLDYEQDFTNNEISYESIKRQLHLKLNATTSQIQSTPKVEIPTFAGSYTQWPTFLDLYRETIHNNMSLSKAQKMQHLKGKLKGEAERLVQHLSVSAENYDTCWELLTHRYDNTQKLFTNLIRTFMSQPVVQNRNAFELKRLHDTSMETVNGIRNLGVDTSTWDPILVHILTEKLDAETYTSYMESRHAPRELPVFDEFVEFLENKFMALEPIHKKKFQPTTSTYTKPHKGPTKEYSASTYKESQNKYKQFRPKSLHISADRNCPLCKTNHVLMSCKKFQEMPSGTKLTTIAELHICRNCLYPHGNKQCNSNKTCRVCNSAHHTSLHDLLRDSTATTSLGQQNLQERFTSHVAGNYNEVLLATLQLQVKAVDGTYVTMRCLLDQGSQINLISESAAQRLGLPRRKENASVLGIGSSNTQSNGTIKLECISIYGDYTFGTDALVMAKILNNLPNCGFDKQYWPHLQGIHLADPNYNISRPVDILLDAGIYADIVTGSIVRGPADAPIALQTKVGWVLLGNMKTYNCHAVSHNLDEVSQFWEIEEITESNNRHMTSDEARCEIQYAATTRRLSDGRYVVKLPMKQNYEQYLGTSKPQAIAQYRQLEKRLAKNNELCESYNKFIDEYLLLGHMKLSMTSCAPSCFLPHHGVLRPESTTTKLRVVFNASANTSTGYSLNQLMECGPNLQQDLQAMLLRWRSYEFVFTADIEKFYRQILVAEEDQHLQKVIWGKQHKYTASYTHSLDEYQLCTVTYGTRAAPYLAMRTIKQLVMDDGKQYPLAATILNNQLYCDDMLAGFNTKKEAYEAQEQLITMLNGGGFKIRKWASNNPTLLKNLPADLISQNMLSFQQAESNKTLGIMWNPQTDLFTYQYKVNTELHNVITKRILLSEISKLYDPLGWISPVTVKAKIMFQFAYTSTSTWDDPLTEKIQQEWLQFREELSTISYIKLSRHIGNTQSHVELHGFSDASEKAYGCVIYCVSTGLQGEKQIKLVAGKTKLAPLNKQITLPRLELCGALLLAQLMRKVKESVAAQSITTYGWTDSMVVLGWLQGDPSRWKTFVANRVTNTIELIPSSCWRYVKSEDNPADAASRGLNPRQLLTFKLWWEGPTWLKTNELPRKSYYETCEEERKKAIVLLNHTSTPLIEQILHNYSSITKATRVLSWIIRFINNTRKVSGVERKSYLTSVELRSSIYLLIKTVQNDCYTNDIINLTQHNRVKSTSKIINLNPILDKDGILRVGGRLAHTTLEHSRKHPIILPNNHKLTELIISQAHKITLHAGAKLTLQYIRTQYWILGGMNTVKRYIRTCVTCHRYRTQHNHQIMADLPKPRVNPSRPFTHTGVDFTGHVEVKANKGRGIKTLKAYIAVFICLCTKAVHLELVSDLTTDAFIAAFKRLCARRGTPAHMYSDNGTNFVGAAKVLAKEQAEALRTYLNTEFFNFISMEGVEWHFNAPSWPTAGGLWEAAVKSLKHHLKRVLGEQRLTFEEFSTLLTQIEACLNSRPLVALSDDTDDLDCITPGHFLIGGPPLGPPLSVNDGRIFLSTRWRLTENMLKDFWRKWSASYLQTLQTRSKWHHPSPNLEIGDMVLVRDDHIPPARWLLGKVTKTHPGADGRVRVVTIKTKTSDTMKRPVTKLSRLPIDRSTQKDEDSPAGTTTSDPVSNKKELRPRKTKTRSSNFLWTVGLLMTICLTQTTSLSINVTSLDPGKLIYLDKLSDMKLIQDEWKMVVYYNMTTYWKSFNYMEKYISHLSRQCTTTDDYQILITQMLHELNELKHYNNILQTEHGLRKRRGLVDGVGYIANSLFGVLDERFAEKYNKDIKRLQLNENHLLALYKNHTSIIEGEYNILKRHEEVMNTQFSAISQRLQHVENNLQKETSRDRYLLITALTGNIILSSLRNTQQLLLDLVTDVKNGRVDTHLLKPEDFDSQLNVISRQVRGGLTLPCTNSYSCTRLMYKISRVHVRLTNSFLIFEVKIPLVTTELYELSRVLPINMKQQKLIRRIIPSTEYLAVDNKRKQLITLNTNEVSSCISTNEHTLLCNLNLPIYDIKTTQSICEAQIISKRATTTCRTTVSDCKVDWIKLQQPSSWLFTCCEECITSIFCTAEVTSLTLRNTGVLTLPEGCMLQGEDILIQSHAHFHSEVQLNQDYEPYVPHSLINRILPTVNESGISTPLESHDEQLKALKEKINSVKEQQETFNVQLDSSEDDVHHYVMYGFIILCVLSVSIWLFTRTRLRRQKKPHNTTDIGLTIVPVPAVVSQATTTSGDVIETTTNMHHGKNDKATSPIP